MFMAPSSTAPSSSSSSTLSQSQTSPYLSSSFSTSRLNNLSILKQNQPITASPPSPSPTTTGSSSSGALSKSSIFQQSCKSVLGNVSKYESCSPEHSPIFTKEPITTSKLTSAMKFEWNNSITRQKSNFSVAASNVSSLLMSPQNQPISQHKKALSQSQQSSTQASSLSSSPLTSDRSPIQQMPYLNQSSNPKTNNNDLMEWLQGNSKIAYEEIMKQTDVVDSSNSPASNRRKRNQIRVSSWDSSFADDRFQLDNNKPASQQSQQQQQQSKNQVNDFYSEFKKVEQKFQSSNESSTNKNNNNNSTSSSRFKKTNMNHRGRNPEEEGKKEEDSFSSFSKRDGESMSLRTRSQSDNPQEQVEQNYKSNRNNMSDILSDIVDSSENLSFCKENRGDSHDSNRNLIDQSVIDSNPQKPSIFKGFKSILKNSVVVAEESESSTSNSISNQSQQLKSTIKKVVKFAE